MPKFPESHSSGQMAALPSGWTLQLQQHQRDQQVQSQLFLEACAGQRVLRTDRFQESLTTEKLLDLPRKHFQPEAIQGAMVANYST